jgi:hypothetical protein
MGLHSDTDIYRAVADLGKFIARATSNFRRDIETPALTPEQQDEAKAWTCVAHILMQGGDHMNEGYLLTTGDRMFWERVYENLSASEDNTARSGDVQR